MPIPKNLEAVAGNWRGSSSLHLSWLPEDERIQTSESEAVVTFDDNRTFLTLHYTWIESGTKQEGLLTLVSNDIGQLTASWVDSWHQNSAVMFLKGAEGSVTGSYSVEGHPDWGWRIEVNPLEGDRLTLLMFNVDPDGTEEWAVEAIYERV